MSDQREKIERQLFTDAEKKASVLHCPACGGGGNGRAQGEPYVNGEFRNVEVKFDCPCCGTEWGTTWKSMQQKTETTQSEQ